MPGFITHLLGGHSALKSIIPSIRENIAPMLKLFNLGTQGPDIFFYYISGFITKRIRGIGSHMHNADLGRFFMLMADKIKGSKSPSQRKILFAYTAGFLAHYAVDVYTHPYIFSQTNDPPHPVLAEAERHRHFETSIDVLMLRNMYGKQPSDYKLGQLIAPDCLQKRVAAASMAKTVRKIYNCDIHPWDVYRAMTQMARYEGYMQSNTGWLKRWLGNLENMVIKARVISALIHMQEVTDNQDYLNVKKAPWNSPFAPEDTRKESFIELFDAAVTDAAQMIEALFAYIHGNLSKTQLASKIQNRSLKTGLKS